MLMIVYVKNKNIYIEFINFIKFIKREKRRIYYEMHRNDYKKEERNNIARLQYMYVIDKLISYWKIGGIKYEKSNYWSCYSHCFSGCCRYWNFSSERF